MPIELLVAAADLGWVWDLPEGNGGLAQSKDSSLSIECSFNLRGSTEKLADLRRELELARALLVAEESLLTNMELMDWSLADVLAVVADEDGSALPWRRWRWHL
jgi:hypothetical protein